MKRICDIFYRFAEYIACICCLILTAVLFVSAFLSTCYSTDMESQLVLTRFDNPFINLLSLALGISLLLLLSRLLDKKPVKCQKLLLLFAFAIPTLIGFFLIAFGRTMPSADAMSVFSIAESFARGDMSAIDPVTSYLSYYPQQIGLVAFYEPIIRLWKLVPTDFAAYHIIKCIYVLLVDIIIWYQYQTIRLLFASDRATNLYLLLAATNLPLAVYSSFVYSEIPSFTALTMGLYYLFVFYRKSKSEKQFSKTGLLSFVLSILFLSLSVLLRKNSLIVIIAVSLVMLLLWLKQPKKYSLLLFVILTVFCSVTILPATQKLYELRGKNTLSSGVTATSYFAMGMQEASRGNGWYNGFNFYTYQDTGMDTALTNEIAKKAITERLSYFKAHPGYAANFYLYKYLSQWVDGTYACRQATLATSGGRRDVAETFYDGAGSRFVIEWCNIYQNILYLGALLFCVSYMQKIHQKNRKTEGTDASCAEHGESAGDFIIFIGLIGVLGGFLFHMLWEANSRYIFLYGLLLLPYAAAGLSDIRRKKEH